MPTPTFDTSFPQDASRCANCGAPAYRHDMVNPPKEGMWTQRFDAERLLREKINSLPAGAFDTIFRAACVDGSTAAIRAALLELLLSGERT